ncbi:hypothetical protein SGFS_037750 [Streptomyces graminofaciens]|uniref:Uncharacterized protein n=1 Tax=Streptomyces graminofaciens TaxID=68212 RepID=A0ABM7F7G3_9ACTN|nr:hypothetical protein [Streptomyces graminofaciens]BBC32481.1 hypothetical protein SGFS_037750 [Streptomyces graminofaciens]
MKKKYSKVLTATGMAACFILGLQGSANAARAEDTSASTEMSITAWPTGCSNGKYEDGWAAKCTDSNGGRYRATVTCKPDGGGPLIVRYPAVWKSKGLSIVYCPPLTLNISGGIITKSTS